MSSADTLLFVARRLGAEGIVDALRRSRRRGRRRFDARGLPELELDGLDDAAAGALVAHAVDGEVTPAVRDRLVAQSDGNPLALVELPKATVGRAARRRRTAPAQPSAHARTSSACSSSGCARCPRRRSGCSPSWRWRTAAARTGAPRRRGGGNHAAPRWASPSTPGSSRCTVRASRCVTRSSGPRSSQGLSCERATRRPPRARRRCSTTSRRGPPRVAPRRRRPSDRTRASRAELERAAERARRRSGHAAAAAGARAVGRAQRRHQSRARRLVAAAAAAWHAGQTAPRVRAPDARRARSWRTAAARRRRPPPRARSSCAAGRCSTPATSSWRAPRDVAPLDTRKALEMLLHAREAAGWAGDTPRTVESGRRAAELPRSDDPETRFLGRPARRRRRLYEGETAIGACRSCRRSSPTPTSSTSRAGSCGPRPAPRAIGDEARAEALLRRAIALARTSGAVDKLTYVLLAYVLMGLLGGRFDVAAEAAEGLTSRRGRRPSERGEHPRRDARVVRRAVRPGGRVPRARPRRRSDAARDERRRFANAIAEWGLGMLELSRRAATRPSTTCWPSGTRGPGRASRTSPCCRPRISSRRRPRRAPGRRPRRGGRDVRGVRAARARRRGRWRSPPAAARSRPRTPRPGSRRRWRLHARATAGSTGRGPQLLLGEHLRRDDRRASAREPSARGAARRSSELGATGWAERAGARAACERRRRPRAPVASRPRRSRRRSCRSPGWSPTGTRTGRSRRGCSSRRGRSTPRCAAIFAKLGVSSRVRAGGAAASATEPLRRAPPLPARARGLAELFRDLRTCAAPALQDALASTLGDPELVVARLGPDGGTPTRAATG